MNEPKVLLGDAVKYFESIFVSNIVYKTKNGYVFYNRYCIVDNGDHYVARRYSDDLIKKFSKLKYAASWCILDKYNKIVEAKRVSELAVLLDSVKAEILVHYRLQKVAASDIREINRDKFLVALDKQKRFQWELDKYIKLAKTCQDKGYQNELTRATRK